MNLTQSIQPKSDQLNADDLIGGPITIRLRDIKGTEDPAQPVSLYYDGDNGKPYKPCKSMRRVLVAAWGVDGKAFIGRSITLFRDNAVVFGGIQVGGIRISHMSHLAQSSLTMPLTMSKAQRRPYTVKLLEVAALPELTPDHKHWAAVVAGLASGKTTIEVLQGKYSISPENVAALSQHTQPEPNA